MKFMSLQFQKATLLLIEIVPKALIDVANLRGGKGHSMLRFAMEFEEAGNYKGVVLNRARVVTRSKRQARLEEYGVCTEAVESDSTVAAVLFGLLISTARW